MVTSERVKIALLIGAPNGLRGVEHDVAVMAAALGGRGFRCVRCVGEDATREGILGEVRRLANNARMYSEVVVYYSGHGGRVDNPGFDGVLRGERQRVRFFPFLLPVDVTKGGVGDFRGILVAELESYFQQIVDGGARLTVIFDCCHAAAVVRSVTVGAGAGHAAGGAVGREVEASPGPMGPAVRALSLETPYLAGLAGHFERLDTQRIALDCLHGVCSPAIVRLTASGEGEAAFERAAEAVKLRFRAADPVQVGEVHGVMTAALVRALAEVGDGAVPWHVVGRRVRALAAAASRQQVMLRGPHRRIVFAEGEDGPRRVAGIAVAEGALTLDVGAMCGVEVGDRFFVWPREVGAPAIGEVRVVRVDASRAWVELCDGAVIPAEDERLTHASVSPAGYARARAAVRWAAESEAGRRFLAALVAERGASTGGDAGGEVAAAVEVNERDGWLEVRRPGGGLLREPADFRPEVTPELAQEALAFVREAVEAIAVGHALVQLASGGSEALRRRVAWSIERRSYQGRQVFDARGLAGPLEVAPGDHLVVDVRRVDGVSGSLFAWVLMVGPGGRVSLLSTSWPHGAEFTGSAPFSLGLRPDGFREGVKIEWPSVGVPRPSQGGDPMAWLVLVLADGPADLTMWETEAVAGWRGRVDRLLGDATRSRAGEMPPGRAMEWAAESVALEIEA